MELSLFGRKRPSRRPPSPEDAENAEHVKHRFSRALGIFRLLRKELGDDHAAVSRDLKALCRSDGLIEVYDAMASDAYRAFIERELDAHFRLSVIDGVTLYAATYEGLPKIDDECRERLKRGGMDRAYSFGIATVRLGAQRLLRKRESNLAYEPAVHDGSPELVEIRALMASHSMRTSLQEELGVAIGFLLPNRLTFARSARSLPPTTLAEQLRLEGVLS